MPLRVKMIFMDIPDDVKDKMQTIIDNGFEVNLIGDD